ncbi:putative prophage P4 integrase [Alteripontixanthobacter maritimus]|uniref:Putative prophage P4 integrase n=1 Tax=Alteripontixanthobacter maritimus TaxID=2161824 RepID=A0A369Q7M0_9SPHN|nr:putative prophage P4 integrase [Alteripontixanthobacter maritimus]
MAKEGRANSTLRKAQWFLSLLLPAIGKMPITEADPQLLLATLKNWKPRGITKPPKRPEASRAVCFGLRWRRAAPSLTRQPYSKGALITPNAKHYAAILEPAKLAELLRAIDAYTGSPINKLALQIAPHVFVRPGMLRHADWSEIDLREKIWRIPAGKMKARKPHSVPLSSQVVASFLSCAS